MSANNPGGDLVTVAFARSRIEGVPDEQTLRIVPHYTFALAYGAGLAIMVSEKDREDAARILDAASHSETPDDEGRCPNCDGRLEAERPGDTRVECFECSWARTQIWDVKRMMTLFLAIWGVELLLTQGVLFWEFRRAALLVNPFLIILIAFLMWRVWREGSVS